MIQGIPWEDEKCLADLEPSLWTRSIFIDVWRKNNLKQVNGGWKWLSER